MAGGSRIVFQIKHKGLLFDGLNKIKDVSIAQLTPVNHNYKTDLIEPDTDHPEREYVPVRNTICESLKRTWLLAHVRVRLRECSALIIKLRVGVGR